MQHLEPTVSVWALCDAFLFTCSLTLILFIGCLVAECLSAGCLVAHCLVGGWWLVVAECLSA